jgi:tetratricopeptide (TPR) repeat protein
VLRHVFGLMVLTCLPVGASAQKQIAAPATAELPFSLTAADGTGLELVALDAKAVVDGPLAFTELKMSFRNPRPRVIEGHFKVVMPDGAAISRFAMKINGAWMEGEVVEKQAARRAYEDALHRRVDPALLEQDSGNRFRARVFPIPANGVKELIISWSHELKTAGESYRLPLMGLPRIRSLKLTALRAGPGIAPKTSLGGTGGRYEVSAVSKIDFKPTEDWVIFGGEIPAEGDALRAGKLGVSRFLVPGDASVQTDLTGAVLLFDTSASRAIDFAGRLEALQTLVAGLPKLGVTHVQVVAFDQDAQSIYEGAPAGFGGKALDALRVRGPLGASSLQAGLEMVARTQGAKRRLILLTDGMVTLGTLGREQIEDQVAALAKVGVERADVVVDTTARDTLMLETLVRSELPRPGTVIEGRDALEAQLARLGRGTLADVKISVKGSAWVWPASARGLQPGDALVVFGDIPAGEPFEVQLSGGVSATISPKERRAEKPLLERAWVAARIARLQKMRSEGDPDMKGAYKAQILELSTRHRVLSPLTAMVILETEADYKRMGIERNALADILVVGPTGVQRMHRATMVVKPPPPPPPKPKPMAREWKKKKGKASSAKSEKADDSFDDDDGVAEPDADGDGVEDARDSEEEPAAERERAPAGDVPAMERAPRPARIAASGPVEQTGEAVGRRELREIEKGSPALTGEMAKIDGDLERGRHKQALKAARAWRARAPADLLALVALGRSYRAAGDDKQAARAFGSILDLYPSRADMRRLAGNWLELLGAEGLALAADTYTVAMGQRPDHPSIYHQLSMVMVRIGRYEEALEVALKGITARRVSGRFEAVGRILQEDAQMIGSAWAAAEPKRKEAIVKQLAAHGLKLDSGRSIRFVLSWETDANDVDFHIFDARFNHAFYSRRGLASGGALYADITTGYGPECFTIHKSKAFPYTLKAHYYSRGPMGYGAGKLQVLRHDGKGGLGFAERPFVIMQDGAFVDLGTVKKGTARVWSKAPAPVAKGR